MVDAGVEGDVGDDGSPPQALMIKARPLSASGVAWPVLRCSQVTISSSGMGDGRYLATSDACRPLNVSWYSHVPATVGTNRKRLPRARVPLSNAAPPAGFDTDVMV